MDRLHFLAGEKNSSDYSFLLYPESLWHKMDISDFHRHKIVNFCNNFVGLTIPDDLKSKIWKF